MKALPPRVEPERVRLAGEGIDQMTKPEELAPLPVSIAPDNESFLRLTDEFRKPAVIRGVVPKWAASKKWNMNALSDICGSAEVEVFVLPNNGKLSDISNEFQIRKMTMVEFLSRRGDPDNQYYAAQNRLVDGLAVLKEDIERPIYMPQGFREDTFFWLGFGGNVTPLHWDLSKILFCQVFGTKTFTLFPPSESSLLYPFTEPDNLAHISRVNLLYPDFEAFPLLADAKSVKLTVEPGDMMFIPDHWWHHVVANEDCASITFWWVSESQSVAAISGH